MLLPIENEPPVSVECASDAQFQAWVLAQGIPVDEDGIPEWSFDDRCGVINHALEHDIPLRFATQNNSENSPKSDVLNSDESASQAM